MDGQWLIDDSKWVIPLSSESESLNYFIGVSYISPGWLSLPVTAITCLLLLFELLSLCDTVNSTESYQCQCVVHSYLLCAVECCLSEYNSFASHPPCTAVISHISAVSHVLNGRLLPGTSYLFFYFAHEHFKGMSSWTFLTWVFNLFSGYIVCFA